MKKNNDFNLTNIRQIKFSKKFFLIFSLKTRKFNKILLNRTFSDEFFNRYLTEKFVLPKILFSKNNV